MESLLLVPAEEVTQNLQQRTARPQLGGNDEL